MATDSAQPPTEIRDVLRDGPRIAAILLFWGILAAIGRYGIANIGFARPGTFFFELGTNLALLFALVGAVSALIYAIARGIQLADH